MAYDDTDPLFARLDRAWDLMAEGDLEAAMESARESLEFDDSSPEAHNLIGYIHAASGNLEAALTCYRTAIENDENYLDAILNAAEVLLQMGDIDGAIAQTDTAVEVAANDDERADAMLLQVDALMFGDRAEEAAEVVRQLPQGPFESSHVDFLVGRALFEVGDIEEAAIAIEHAAAVGVLDAEVFYYLGLVREAQNDLRGALVAFLQSRDLDRNAPRPPWAESSERFERRVGQALKRLPGEVSKELDGALILVDELPGAEVVSEGVDPRQPVLLDEVDLGDEHEGLRRVFVYQRNIERLVPAPEFVEEAIAALIADELQRMPQA
ncbi:MAG: tetratricopeptide repeat protein [Myxococcota bacterium]